MYFFQQDNEKLVCGCRDNTIRIYRKQAPNSSLVLKGHTGSVLSLAYDDILVFAREGKGSVDVEYFFFLSNPISVCVFSSLP